LPIQNERFVEPAIWGAVRGHSFLKTVFDFYTDEINLSGEFMFPNIMKLLLDRQYKLGAFPARNEQKIFSTPDGMITFYPEEYFIPYRWNEKFMPTCITEKTTTVHWFKGSWCGENTHVFFKTWFFANKARETLKLLSALRPLVSVVIPVYNVEKYLAKCVDSVLTQTYTNIEIIFVNDCSTDNSADILNVYAIKDARIKILTHDKNQGLSCTRNTGIAHANGQYITFIDSDDWVDSVFIEKMLGAMLLKRVDVVCNCNVVEVTDTVISKFQDKGITQDKFVTPDRVYQMAWCYMYKKEFLDLYQPVFPPGLKHEDEYIYHTVIMGLPEIYAVAGGTYYYNRLNPNAISLKHQKNTIDYYDFINMAGLIYSYYVHHNIIRRIPFFMKWHMHIHTNKNEHFCQTKRLFEKMNDYITSHFELYPEDEQQFFKNILGSKNYIDFCSKTQQFSKNLAVFRNKLKQEIKET
jgi:glycosyltransferase involved in cell wall biosynthesis